MASQEKKLVQGAIVNPSVPQYIRPQTKSMYLFFRFRNPWVLRFFSPWLRLVISGQREIGVCIVKTGAREKKREGQGRKKKGWGFYFRNKNSFGVRVGWGCARDVGILKKLSFELFTVYAEKNNVTKLGKVTVNAVSLSRAAGRWNGHYWF